MAMKPLIALSENGAFINIFSKWLRLIVRDERLFGRIVFLTSLLFCDFSRLLVRNYAHPFQEKFKWAIFTQASRIKAAPRRRPGGGRSEPIRLGIYLQSANSDLVRGHTLDQLKDISQLLGIKIFLYDVLYDGKQDEGVATFADTLKTYDFGGGTNYFNGYRNVPDPVAYWRQIEKIVQDINSDAPDYLLLLKPTSKDIFDVLQGVTVPVIGNLCFGSMINCHPKVDFNIWFQPQIDLYKQGDRIYSAIKEGYLSDAVAYDNCFYYALHFDEMLGNLERQEKTNVRPYALYHGRLSKIRNRLFLATVAGLLKAEDDLDFVFVGREDIPGAVESIIKELERQGLGKERIRYGGYFRYMQNNYCEQEAAQMAGILKNASLALDPWPVCGGSSLVEGYLADIPAVSMGITNEAAADCYCFVDLPFLRVPENLAITPAVYIEKSIRLMHDEDHRAWSIERQREIAARYTDGRVFWQQVVGFFTEQAAKKEAYTA